MLTEIYDIGGMHCAACAAAIERVTKKLHGVRRSNVNLVMNRMTIEYDETAVSADTIIQKIEKAGFSATLHTGDLPKDVSPQILSDEKKRLIILIVLAVIVSALSMSHMLMPVIPLSACALLQFFFTLPTLYYGKHYFINGYRALFHASPNMDTLVALSATASFLYSLVALVALGIGSTAFKELYFESAAMILALVSLGKFLEHRNSEKTKDALNKLRALAPTTALLLKDGKTIETPISELKVHDLIKIQTGMSVPVDGVVTEGEGHINESMMTGESRPVAKKPGDPIIGASLVMDGNMTIRAEKVGNDTALSKMIQFVEEAQGQKAPITRIIDKVSSIFVPAVLAIALLSALIWLYTAAPIAFALKIFASVLVIACPCAMGLATPTAMIAGTGLGATHGILFRSGEALEITHNIKTIVFDKTGTLTQGKPIVTDIISEDKQRCLELAASLEINISHPIARAICDKAKDDDISLHPITDFHAIPGHGISANTKDGIPLMIGNISLMENNHIDISKYREELSTLQSQKKTVVCLALNQIIIGIIAISDTIREEAPKMIKALHAMNIKTIMLTGDQKDVAEQIANQLNIDDYRAGIVPTQKADIIKELQEDGNTVMMVGDGINDAPALTQANIGCAIGSGSDIAIDSAQIILIKSNLMDVIRVIRLSKQTMKKIKQNLFWAFAYNTLGIPIAAGVLYPQFGILLSPIICAAAMCLSSIFVVTNALTLKKYPL